jgi:hypothetical protein
MNRAEATLARARYGSEWNTDGADATDFYGFFSAGLFF